MNVMLASPISTQKEPPNAQQNQPSVPAHFVRVHNTNAFSCLNIDWLNKLKLVNMSFSNCLTNNLLDDASIGLLLVQMLNFYKHWLRLFGEGARRRRRSKGDLRVRTTTAIKFSPLSPVVVVVELGRLPEWLHKLPSFPPLRVASGSSNAVGYCAIVGRFHCGTRNYFCN